LAALLDEIALATAALVDALALVVDLAFDLVVEVAFALLVVFLVVVVVFALIDDFLVEVFLIEVFLVEVFLVEVFLVEVFLVEVIDFLVEVEVYDLDEVDALAAALMVNKGDWLPVEPSVRR